jgi:hypothetical protein
MDNDDGISFKGQLHSMLLLLDSSQCSHMASFACFVDAFLPESHFFSFSILKLNVIVTIGFPILS